MSVNRSAADYILFRRLVEWALRLSFVSPLIIGHAWVKTCTHHRLSGFCIVLHSGQISSLNIAQREKGKVLRGSRAGFFCWTPKLHKEDKLQMSVCKCIVLYTGSKVVKWVNIFKTQIKTYQKYFVIVLVFTMFLINFR